MSIAPADDPALVAHYLDVVRRSGAGPRGLRELLQRHGGQSVRELGWRIAEVLDAEEGGSARWRLQVIIATMRAEGSTARLRARAGALVMARGARELPAAGRAMLHAAMDTKGAHPRFLSALDRPAEDGEEVPVALVVTDAGHTRRSIVERGVASLENGELVPAVTVLLGLDPQLSPAAELARTLETLPDSIEAVLFSPARSLSSRERLLDAWTLLEDDDGLEAVLSPSVVAASLGQIAEGPGGARGVALIPGGDRPLPDEESLLIRRRALAELGLPLALSGAGAGAESAREYLERLGARFGGGAVTVAGTAAALVRDATALGDGGAWRGERVLPAQDPRAVFRADARAWHDRGRPAGASPVLGGPPGGSPLPDHRSRLDLIVAGDLSRAVPAALNAALREGRSVGVLHLPSPEDATAGPSAPQHAVQELIDARLVRRVVLGELIDAAEIRVLDGAALAFPPDAPSRIRGRRVVVDPDPRASPEDPTPGWRAEDAASAARRLFGVEPVGLP